MHSGKLSNPKLLVPLVRLAHWLCSFCLHSLFFSSLILRSSDSMRSSFLAMTTLVCRNNTGFDGESRSIAASIRAMAPYNFSWAVYVPELQGSKHLLLPNMFRMFRSFLMFIVFFPFQTMVCLGKWVPHVFFSVSNHLPMLRFEATVFEVIVSDPSEEGKCPGLESFRELRQPNVRMLYRPCLRLLQKKSLRGRFSMV